MPCRCSGPIMLPAKHRLKQSADFKNVYTRGGSYAVGPVVVYSLKTGQDTRVGFSVSRKLGNAVKRNRVRRLLREAVRSMLDRIGDGFDVVIVARKSASGLSLEDFQRALETAFHRKGMLN